MSIAEEATVTSKGQVTIPQEIRDRLGIETGDELEFSVEGDGTLLVRRKEPSLSRLRAVRETIAAERGEIDLDAMRRRAKREWSSLDER